MNNKKFLSTLLVGLLCLAILSGCSETTAANQEAPSVPQGNSSALVSTSPGNPSDSESGDSLIQTVSFEASTDDYYFDWKTGSYTTINLANGSNTITKSGIYELTGTLNDGGITVNIDKSVDKGTVFLVLNNANIGSASGTPINIIEAKKVVLILENGTTNTVTQGSITTSDESFPSAAIFSKADMTITGGGILNVTTEYNDGITGKDDLVITDGTINIQSAGDGIVGKDLLAIEKATVQITAGKDGMRSTNSADEGKGNIVIAGGSLTINATNDAIQSEKVLQIGGGTFDLTSCGGYPGKSIKTGDDFGSFAPAAQMDTTSSESLKGIKAGMEINISNGSFTISAYEDAIHSNGDVTISGASFSINAGDDGIHADNTVTIKGGDIQIANCYEGIEGTNITVSNGKINVISSDDGLNVSANTGTMTISGGEISIESGGDAIDSNGNLTVTGGKLTINTSTISQGNDALDYDRALTFTGGTITDQNGNAIDPTIRTGPGGGMGGGMGGGRGNRIKPPGSN